MKKKYSHLIWDWNGTLFNDIKWCIEVMNNMLIKRKMTPILDIEAYHRAFCFPITAYYKNIGFDFSKEPFEALAVEFIEAYHENKSGNSKLHIGVESVLAHIAKRGITQVILSASQIDHLLSQLREFDITYYFDAILGLSNVYAKSKVDIGLDYMAKNDVVHALMLGDTVHDYEVARSLGIDCLLFSTGHQSKETLQLCGVPVLDAVSEVLNYI